MIRPPFIVTLLLLITLTGCSAYYDDYRYLPRPAVAEVHPTSGPRSTVATAMGSIIGMRKADSEQGIPQSVEVRLRLENTSTDPIDFDPRTLELTTGQLISFPPPIVHAPSSVSLDSMQATTLTAFFPIRDWNDLDTLVLRWIIRIKGQPVAQLLTFRRAYASTYYYDPYWAPYRGYPPHFWYGGVVVLHRR